MAGLIHIYCGDGKGKTTAAAGLALRAAGAGKKVIFAQFFKDGTSSEIGPLKNLPGVTVLVRGTHYGFFRNMDAGTKEKAADDYTGLFRDAIRAAADTAADEAASETAQEPAVMLILDEAFSACRYGMIPEAELLDFLDHKPEGLEVVMTGRDPSEDLCARADYITEMKKERHPYDQGIPARKGIEY